MPKLRRKRFPLPLLSHLLDRIALREIAYEDLVRMTRWVESDPEVPAGPWFKRFPGLIVCGEGELVKAFLRADQTPVGIELQ